MPESLLEQTRPSVDKHKVGISYSGGGPLLLIELGIAQAFVDLKIWPAVIAGVSAGAIAATAHALDPIEGRGLKAAAKALMTVSDGTVKLSRGKILLDVLWERGHLAGLGDNDPLRERLGAVFGEVAGKSSLDFSYFGSKRPQLIVGAADRISGKPVWFGTDLPHSAPQADDNRLTNVDVGDALVASSAIPGVFPAKKIQIGKKERVFVDGGVVSNQPLSVLTLRGCGTLYSCAVGYNGGRLAAPVNLIDNAMQSISIAIHAASRLEESLVNATLGDAATIYHIHPDVAFPVQGFNFSEDAVTKVMAEACSKTKRWIKRMKWLP